MKNLIYILCIALIWGVGFLLMKFAGYCFDPITIATGRVFISAITLGGFCLYKKTLWVPPNDKIIPLLIIIILGFCYPFAMQPFLVNLYGSGYVGMMLAFLPLFTLILGRIILKSKITLHQLIGIIGGLIFTYLLFHASLELDISPFGFLIALTVPLAYTISNIYIKRDFPRINPIAFTATCACIAGFLMIPFTIANFTYINSGNIYWSLGSIIILGVLMSGAALALFYHVIQQSGPLIASLTNYVVPIFALFWGWFDGEKTTSLQIIGITGIFIMIYITQPPTRKSKIVSEKT